MMRDLAFKFGLFVVVWYEVAAELRLGADMAFMVALALFGGGWLAMRLSTQVISLIGPVTFGALLQAAVWIGLFWWLAPATFRTVPFVFDLVVLAGLVLGGARCRFLFEEFRQQGGRIALAGHSELVLAAAAIVLTACMLALRNWGSLWPLFGFALLVALPFGFGWRMAPVAAAARHDAKVGDDDAFRDAGLSDEF